MCPAVAVGLAVLVAACAWGCGGAGTTPRGPGVAGAGVGALGAQAAPYVIGDADDDDRGLTEREPEDEDDHFVRKLGRDGTEAERRTIANLLSRYYGAAASGEGAKACSLMDSSLAHGHDLERSLPAELRPAAGSSVMQGEGCAGVETLLFHLNRPQLALERASVLVAALRVQGARAVAVLRFRSIGEREIPFQKSQGQWKIAALTDDIVR